MQKIFIVMLSEAKHLFVIPNMVNFVKGDRGGYLRSAPLIPLNNHPNPLTPFKCALRLYMPIVHSACVNVMPTARTLPLCAVVGDSGLVSNRESKIAIFKAALCCGFAIALRALFLGILPYSPSLAEGGRGWVVMLSASETSLFVIASIR